LFRDGTKADYSNLNLTQLRETRRVDDFDAICHVGNTFAQNYDFPADFISNIREKFEETEELTWKSFEATMDQTIGNFVDQETILTKKYTFFTGLDFGKFDTRNDFFELLIILKRMNLGICEHSSFLIIDEIVV